MGFVSYDEDIQSRLIHDRRSCRFTTYSLPESPRAVTATRTARTSNTTPSREDQQVPHPQEFNAMAIQDIQVTQARPLPVFVLADISGSMAEAGKIGGLNQGVRELVAALASAGELFAQPQVGVITFGGTAARVHQQLTPAVDVHWADMNASGMTPMGGAFALVREQIEDRTVVPSNAYRPVLVLVSDGQPNDAWETALDDLLVSERGAKADRFALAIGPDANRAMLERFTGSRERVLLVDEAKGILRFFRFVTMSVLNRSRATHPNQLLPPPVLDWDP